MAQRCRICIYFALLKMGAAEMEGNRRAKASGWRSAKGEVAMNPGCEILLMDSLPPRSGVPFAARWGVEEFRFEFLFLAVIPDGLLELPLLARLPDEIGDIVKRRWISKIRF